MVSFISPANQTVVQNIQNQVVSSVDSLASSVTQTVSSAESLATGLASSLYSAGVGLVQGADVLAGQLDKLITGSDSFFTSSSPKRVSPTSFSSRQLAQHQGINPQSKTQQSQSSTKGNTILSFPSDLSSTKYFMTFNFANYQRPNALTSNTTLSTIATINLPLPLGLNDNTTADWGTASSGITGDALNAIQNSGTEKMSTTAIDSAKTVVSKSLAKITGGNDILSTVTGQTPNPVTAAIFSNIEFRHFQFSWMFAPKTAAESSTLRTIINTIKSLHLAQLTGTDQILFQYPSIVKPQIVNQQAQSFMTDFKWCAIQSLNVNYAPATGSPTFFAQTNAPVMIQLDMSLVEIEYRLPGDYDTTTGSVSTQNIIDTVKNGLGTQVGSIMQQGANFVQGETSSALNSIKSIF